MHSAQAWFDQKKEFLAIMMSIYCTLPSARTSVFGGAASSTVWCRVRVPFVDDSIHSIRFDVRALIPRDFRSTQSHLMIAGPFLPDLDLPAHVVTCMVVRQPNQSAALATQVLLV